LHDRGVDDGRIDLLPPWAPSSPLSFDRADARRRLGWPGRAFVALHHGAPQWSGPHADAAFTATEAAARLAPDCLLVPTPPDEADRALALVAADVVVLTDPSTGDGLVPPDALAASLFAGRPVVAATALDGAVAAELGRTDGAGVVVRPGDADGLAEALLALRADPLRRVAMGLAAIAHAEAYLSPRAVLARFDRIVDAALAHH
jgi:colanic acid biosynthesis glycosyl transferase WcaI